MHPDLAGALSAWRAASTEWSGHVVRSERGGPMAALSIVVWFKRAYAYVGLEGCSSHSGRRTFITRAARLVHEAGGSLRDVQLLAGHRSIQTTQRYIDGDTGAQRKPQARVADLRRRRFAGLPRDKGSFAKNRRSLEIRVTTDSMDHCLWTTPWTTNLYIPIPISRTPCRWCTPRAALPGRHREYRQDTNLT
jgi:hypothetical protein